MNVLAPSLASLRPATRSRSAAAKAAAKPVAVAQASNEAKEVSRRAALSLAAVRGCPYGRVWRAWASSCAARVTRPVFVVCVGRCRAAGQPPRAGRLRRGRKRVRRQDQPVGCVAASICADQQSAVPASRGAASNLTQADLTGSCSIPAGFVPYAGDGYALLLPGKWNPSKEREFPGMDVRCAVAARREDFSGCLVGN